MTDSPDRLDVHALLPHGEFRAQAGRAPLAEFRFRGSGPARADALVIDVPLERIELAAPSPDRILWTSPDAPERRTLSGFDCALTPSFAVGTCAVDAEDVERAARELYGNLFDLLGRVGPRHLLRIWNVVPRIHEGDPEPGGGALERYRAFCRGRADAFEAALGGGFEAALPAASAVGSDDGPLLVAFLAARTPPEHLENPRQLAAWRYPERYGPRPPSFARATRTGVVGSELLLSGTASIVGHETVHAGDVARQTAETLHNLDQLCDAPPRAHRPRSLRAFVRDPLHADGVVRMLKEHYGSDLPVLALRADICREDLLVEVEGIARPVEETAVPPPPSAAGPRR